MSKAGVETRSQTRRRQASEKFTIKNYFEVQPAKPTMPLLGSSEETQGQGAEASTSNSASTSKKNELDNTGTINTMNSRQNSDTDSDMVEVIVNPATNQTEMVPVRVANFMNILKQAANEVTVNAAPVGQNLTSTNSSENNSSETNKGKIVDIQVDVPGTPDRVTRTEKTKTSPKRVAPQKSAKPSTPQNINIQEDVQDTITEEEDDNVRTNLNRNTGWDDNNTDGQYDDRYPANNQVELEDDELMENLDEVLEQNAQTDFTTATPPDGEITLAVLAKLIQNSETNIRKDLATFQGAVRHWQLKAIYRIRS